MSRLLIVVKTQVIIKEINGTFEGEVITHSYTKWNEVEAPEYLSDNKKNVQIRIKVKQTVSEMGTKLIKSANSM